MNQYNRQTRIHYKVHELQIKDSVYINNDDMILAGEHIK